MARKRTARRQAERGLRKDVRQTEKLAAAAPGGSLATAVVVTTPAVIDPHVRSARCPQCGGEFDVRTDRAEGPHVRAVNVICRQCHAPRELWFRIEAPLAN